jgi:hypothetical protein
MVAVTTIITGTRVFSFGCNGDPIGKQILHCVQDDKVKMVQGDKANVNCWQG